MMLWIAIAFYALVCIALLIHLWLAPEGFEDSRGFHYVIKDFESAPAITQGAKLVGERMVNPHEPASTSNGAATAKIGLGSPDIVPSTWIRKYVRFV